MNAPIKEMLKSGAGFCFFPFSVGNLLNILIGAAELKGNPVIFYAGKNFLLPFS